MLKLLTQCLEQSKSAHTHTKIICVAVNCFPVVFPFFYYGGLNRHRTSQVAPMVKNPSASAGGIRDPGLIPGWGRSLGGGHGNPLQYSCLENPMDRETWPATVHRVEKSRIGLKQLSKQTHKLNTLILIAIPLVLTLLSPQSQESSIQMKLGHHLLF